MNIDALIAALGGRYDADEAEVIARVLRESGGTIPDDQLIEEAGLALAVYRRWSGRMLPAEKPEDVGILCSGLPTGQFRPASPCHVGFRRAGSPAETRAPRRRWRFWRRGRG